MDGGDRRAHRFGGAPARWHHRGFDLETGQQLGHQCVCVRQPGLADVLGSSEGQHRPRTGRQRSEGEGLGGELPRGLVVVCHADRELASVGERGDGGVEAAVAVGTERARPGHLGAGQCGSHRRG